MITQTVCLISVENSTTRIDRRGCVIRTARATVVLGGELRFRESQQEEVLLRVAIVRLRHAMMDGRSNLFGRNVVDVEGGDEVDVVRKTGDLKEEMFLSEAVFTFGEVERDGSVEELNAVWNGRDRIGNRLEENHLDHAERERERESREKRV